MGWRTVSRRHATTAFGALLALAAVAAPGRPAARRRGAPDRPAVVGDGPGVPAGRARRGPPAVPPRVPERVLPRGPARHRPGVPVPARPCWPRACSASARRPCSGGAAAPRSSSSTSRLFALGGLARLAALPPGPRTGPTPRARAGCSPPWPRWWSLDLVSAAAVTAVIWLKVRELDEGVLAEAVTTGLVAALTNASLGLLVVVLVRTRPVALVLLVGVLVTVALAYRGYSALGRSHARLESLYRFTRGVQEQVGTVEVSDAVLRQARDILAAQTAELVAAARPRRQQRRACGCALVGDELVRGPARVPPWLREAAEGTPGAPARAGRRRPAGRAWPRPLHVDGSVDAAARGGRPAAPPRPVHRGGPAAARLAGQPHRGAAAEVPPARPAARGGRPAGAPVAARRPDRPAQPPPRPAPPCAPSSPAAGAAPSSSWTSTASPTSTRPSGTARATSCCARWGSGCGRGGRPRATSPGSATTSSSSCCAASAR